MANGYQVVFQSSYFSNGWLLVSLACLAIGLGVTIAAIRGKLQPQPKRGCAVALTTLWCILWMSFSIWFFVGTLATGRKYTTVLREGRCEVVEGVVEVFFEQPGSGHAPGDHIRINGQDFEYSYYHATLSYHRTIAHGGVLKRGAKARLHYFDGAILKVEIADE